MKQIYIMLTYIFLIMDVIHLFKYVPLNKTFFRNSDIDRTCIFTVPDATIFAYSLRILNERNVLFTEYPCAPR